MKRRIDIKSLFLGATLGASLVFAIGAAPDREPASVEYKTLRENVTDSFDAKLNNMADQGWTLVSSSAMHIPGNAALSEVGIDHRQEVHARSNREDLTNAQQGIEASNDPGQAKRVYNPVQHRERKKYCEQIDHRRMLESRSHFGQGNTPKDEQENE